MQCFCGDCAESKLVQLPQAPNADGSAAEWEWPNGRYCAACIRVFVDEQA
jgi:hypothetical protein